MNFTRSLDHEVKQIINDDSLGNTEENASSTNSANMPVEHLCVPNIFGQTYRSNECDGISETVRYLLFDMRSDKKSLLDNLLSPFK